MEEYKKDREDINPDSDGIYIIIKGEAKVVNPYDEYKFGNVKAGEHFGGNKLLKE